MYAYVHVAQEDLARTGVGSQQTGGPRVGQGGWSVEKHLFDPLTFLDSGCRDLPWASLLEAGSDYHFSQRCPVSQL